MVTKKKVEPVKKKVIEKPVIEERELNIPDIIIVKKKINWIGINRKIREYGRTLKIYNLTLPEFRFITWLKLQNKLSFKEKYGFDYKVLWQKYCNWWNKVINHE